jgi:hypothetical protein
MSVLSEDRVPIMGGEAGSMSRRSGSPAAMGWVSGHVSVANARCSACARSNAHPNTELLSRLPPDAGSYGSCPVPVCSRRPPSLSAMQTILGVRDHGPGPNEVRARRLRAHRHGGASPLYINAGTQYMDLSISMSQVERVSGRRPVTVAANVSATEDRV